MTQKDVLQRLAEVGIQDILREFPVTELRNEENSQATDRQRRAFLITAKEEFEVSDLIALQWWLQYRLYTSSGVKGAITYTARKFFDDVAKEVPNG